ncbi:hypothetical protein PFAG_04586 [Plasmodium falciparum Santa Lucia]|uniref:ATP-dependent RNA helicase DBP8, putative n=12 Tax=Plasmodium falciparum TaxID=5833 RepID=Q8IE01_PLAF7|nr:ATP-dependent RNA helicase DBP8, putative [Plasmodium falciparum 3D7]ABK58712.1 SF2-family helicase [Plasmodium falciparum]ETW16928.1 hypothetical protein PFFVO_04193 [Plasmodium falciparum Vietnam Oak-Knoll (FVO)]ETW27722.1 hypothetical protein PFFCH_04847 [Plasmodium falciparum FCH/4]ETW34738.1 hypothetical protein PFTANZ_04537 [Plasmodium falciparum Tanzania (2000708)]ETW41125.1 hypothetical protein PFNF135_04759 [Plasmodium falciparum NF135/5.C10]ETW47584.1 hypothetical protein PFMALIP|eukprot:XP_001350058.1 ATP-dependent RNA helicase DBP8, putative [Plasmodium falciparum 3D7]
MIICARTKKPSLRFCKLFRRYYIRKFLKNKIKEDLIKKKRYKYKERENVDGTRLYNEEQINSYSDQSNNITFEELGVEDWLIKISKSVHILYPTKIQQLCLPLIIQGKNVIGSSETGSGKTICYCWSILQELNKNVYGIFSLILLPTRELVFQIIEQFHLYGSKIGVMILSCIGGFSLIEQRKSVMTKPHIIVGTPGRISDILESSIDIQNCFKRLRFLVLDEADLLLQKCFEDKLQNILNNLPKNYANERKTLFFSSTITNSLQLLIDTFPYNNLILVNVNKKQKPPKNLDQRYIYVEEIAHITYLIYILKNKVNNLSGIIFTANSYKCELVYTVLNMLGIDNVDAMHSSKDQKNRFATLAKFKNGLCKILVATDIISRGIDIPKISFVINFDFPNDTVQYIHRVGRTARANRKGLAISFIDKKDVNSFNQVKNIMKDKLKPYTLNKKEVLENMFKIGRVIKKAEIMLEEKKDIKRENERLKHYIFHNE